MFLQMNKVIAFFLGVFLLLLLNASFVQAASIVPSIEIQGSVPNVCNASHLELPVLWNVTGNSSDSSTMSVQGLGTVFTLTENNSAKNVTGTYVLDPVSYNVALGTPVTVTITTYNGINQTGGISYSSTIVFACDTGNVISLKSGPVTVWSGDVSFVVKTTSTYQDPSGNIKFKTQSQRLAGKIQTFIGENGNFVTNAAGNYIEVLDNTGSVVIGVKEIGSIATDVRKSKSNNLSLVGTGDFTEPGSSPAITGIAYIDLHGKLKEDSTGKPISMTVSAKIGGGVNTAQDNFVFSTNVKSKMLPQ
jgi:hypothetical protein